MSHHLCYNGIIGRLQISGLPIYYARTLLRGIETGYRVNTRHYTQWWGRARTNSNERRVNRMTNKQKRFCEEYLVDLNATQAALRTGYSEKTAASIASENLQKPEILGYIAKLRVEQSKRTGITADKVLEELSKVAFFPAEECELKASDKLRALELIGKHIGMFKSDDAADAPALEKLDKILAEVKSDADRETKAIHRRSK